MATPTIGILGGYGYTGTPLVRLLLKHTDAHIVIAGRKPQRAREAAQTWNQEFPGQRVCGVYADAACSHSLWEAFDGIDLLVVAAPLGRHTETVARAALRLGCDYLDIVFSSRKLKTLQGLAGDITRAGRTFITDAGYHPGLPALLVRYAGTRFERLDVANVWSAFGNQGGYPLTDSLYEFVEELSRFQCMAYRDGHWHRATGLGLGEMRQTEFGFGFGVRSCAPMMLEEIRALPQMLPSLQETAFYIAGSNWLVDWVVMPVMLLAGKVAPRLTRKPLAYLLHWATRCCAHPPYGAVLKLEACGRNGDRREQMRLQLYHHDPYALTAVGTAVCVLQYLEGLARRPGLWLAGHICEPTRAIPQMQTLGVQCQQEIAPIQGACPLCGRSDGK